jgi:hypothetical protein
VAAAFERRTPQIKSRMAMLYYDVRDPSFGKYDRNRLSA